MIHNKNTTPKGGAKMKKLLFILLACFISVSMVSLGIAQTPDGIPADEETICDDAGLTGSAWDLCNAYCQAQDCDLIDPDAGDRPKKSCEMLRKNYAKHTGTNVMPCDIVACAICGDPDPCFQQGTLGVCQEMMSYQCDAIDGSLNVGEYPCDVVTIPADVAPGCSQIPPQWGLIPDCQYTGPAFVCRIFIGGVLVDKCPAPPTCLTACSSDDDCLTDNEFGYGYICVDEQCAPDCECDGDVCVPN
jgi:hypothetical protein